MDICEICGGSGDVYDQEALYQSCPSCRGRGLKKIHAPVQPDPYQLIRAMDLAVATVEAWRPGQKMGFK